MLLGEYVDADHVPLAVHRLDDLRRARFVMQGSVREWTRRIAETTQMLAPLSAAQRVEVLTRQPESSPETDPPHMHPPWGGRHAGAHPPAPGFLRLPLFTDFENALREQLRGALGPGYGIEIGPTPEPSPPAIDLPPSFFEAHEQ